MNVVADKRWVLFWYRAFQTSPSHPLEELSVFYSKLTSSVKFEVVFPFRRLSTQLWRVAASLVTSVRMQQPVSI